MANPLTSIRKALATYLGTQLTGVTVSQNWPAPGKALPAQAVTVLTAGPPTVEFFGPLTGTVTPGVSPNGTVNYAYGWVWQPLQIDAWALYEATRDTLADSVHAALNRHPLDTLGGTSTFTHYPRQGGLVLALSDQFSAPCDYRFDALPSPQEGSGAAQTSEWRATWQGTARMALVDQVQVALIKSLNVRITVNNGTVEIVNRGLTHA